MSEFFSMDGYAVYVWPSFAITFIAMTWAVVVPWRRHRRLRRMLAGVGR